MRRPIALGQRQAGISLVESLLVMGLLALLLGMGVPGLSQLLAAQRLRVCVDSFLAAVNFTRAEAIRRGARVDLIPLDGRDWSTGWMVFVDDNGNLQAETNEEILLQHAQTDAKVQIHSGFSGAAQYLSYNANGRSRTHASSQQVRAGHWQFSAGQQRRKLIINFLGRPRVCNPQTAKANC